MQQISVTDYCCTRRRSPALRSWSSSASRPSRTPSTQHKETFIPNVPRDSDLITLAFIVNKTDSQNWSKMMHYRLLDSKVHNLLQTQYHVVKNSLNPDLPTPFLESVTKLRCFDTCLPTQPSITFCDSNVFQSQIKSSKSINLALHI